MVSAPARLVVTYAISSWSIGNSTTTFTTFKPSADVSKFQPTGVENCPKASGCQQSVSSMRVSYQVEQLLKEF